MTIAGVKLPQRYPEEETDGAVGYAVVFVLPTVVVTAISIFLFVVLTNFTMRQLDMFSITVMAAIIASLVITAGIQVLVYRMVDLARFTKAEAAVGAIRAGSLIAVGICIFISVPFYEYLVNVLGYPFPYFAYFAALLLLYSLTWVNIAALWATDRNQYPPIVFIMGYLTLFMLTYAFHQLDPETTIAAYTLGIAILLWLSALATRRAFGKPDRMQPLTTHLADFFKLAPKNIMSILFQLLYTVAIFLDKIIVWVVIGMSLGEGLSVTGPYSVGSFLGLIPVFSLGAVAYFTRRSGPLVLNRYKGPLHEIEGRIENYKRLYSKSLTAMLITAFALFLIVSALGAYFISDLLTLRVLITVSIGSLFLMVIVYNSAVLPLFGKGRVSTLAISMVCLGELASLPFVAAEPWYAAVGFLGGSFAGCLLSYGYTIHLFDAFEYHMFHMVLTNS